MSDDNRPFKPLGIPGVLKNAIDWASQPTVRNPLRHKPIALMGASGGMFGTARSRLAIRRVRASAIEAHTMIKPELVVSQAGQKFDESNNLTDDDIRATGRTRRSVGGLEPTSRNR